VRYLEADPWTFGSGYAKATLFRRLRRAEVDEAQAQRLRAVLLHHVDVGNRWEFREACSLARRLGGLRPDLRDRLHADDEGAALRALTMLLRLDRPRLSEGDRARGRALLLRSAGSRQWSASGSVANQIRRLWTPEWGEELVAMADVGEDLVAADAALRLLRQVPHLADRARGAGP